MISTISSTCVLIRAERFKELCFQNRDDNRVNEINTLLGQIFDPDKPLNTPNLNDVETLKNYITGGTSYDLFKKKCKHQI